ncbi:TPA: LPS O-antigen length regulator Wzz(fepE) [Yersinia enterocolitica]|uniref:LPS O-antigen length regulator Wzz(fepE) n=1 Tax=Yersinia enterocolitica TaxID=630 RepID=UPI0021E75469|nr:LPS O-antigen length regulator Wzz(fepE) [Yersinia enterocolitica]UYJ83767.1 LPS O-antigen length regulator Wzz(fepE) [Yersinia enterocolitica]UYK13145.1 LPS O-antigen length regulator Wzz(fepE) [Yersinia enterocolitica]HDL7926881.1 LPS O-antigen length regulator [Yersinia enterocolitica]HDL7933092.1 LPS O-antigen length regulator [Yersinia enterocolitica]HDY4895989.1 LPS O-antigen length regulator [Yersinia enterocolitica]
MEINRLENKSSHKVIQQARDEEIDLLHLLSKLYASKRKIVIISLLFAVCGLAVSFLLPQKFTSRAIIVPPESENIIELRRVIIELTVLGVEMDLDAGGLYNLFLKKFDSQDLRERFLSESPYGLALIKNTEMDKNELYRSITKISQGFTLMNNGDPKKYSNIPYASWTLSFSAPNAEHAQQVLENYIQFITIEVNKDVINKLKSAVELKVNFEKNKLALDRIALESEYNIKVKRLGYSLQLANAAGLKSPVYSNGQAVKDDLDYPVSLGSDGLAEKLKIERSIKDVTQLDLSVQNRKHILSALQALNLSEINFIPYSFQMHPSFPQEKDGLGKSKILIIVLVALVGFILAAVLALIRKEAEPRKQTKDI